MSDGAGNTAGAGATGVGDGGNTAQAAAPATSTESTKVVQNSSENGEKPSQETTQETAKEAKDNRTTFRDRIKNHFPDSDHADNETFPITIEGITKLITISRVDARSFKENWGKAEVRGQKQLKENLKDWEYFNLVIIHPVTKSD